MRKLLMVGAVTAALLLPTASQAQLTLGARVGYGFGLGDVGGTLGMDDWVKSQVPLQVDALFRVTPQLGLGGYFSYGFGQLGDDVDDECDAAGVDCTARVTRLGIQAIYTFVSASQFTPWLGAGFGYEWNTVDNDFEELTFKGWEYLNLQAGGDFRAGDRFWVGPYVMFSIGEYDDFDGPGVGLIIDEKWHQWLSFGLRGKFDL